MWRKVLTLAMIAVLEHELQSLFIVAQYHNVIILMITFLGVIKLNLEALHSNAVYS